MSCINIHPTRHLFMPTEDHTIYKNNDGKCVPSTTMILKVINKPALFNWANYLGWKHKSLKEDLDKSSLIGSLTHSYISQILLKNDIDLSALNIYSAETCQSVINALKSFITWYKNNKNILQITHSEFKMEGKYYGGTLDFFGFYDDNPIIIDFKTSKKFYFTMFLQLAGYVQLYEELYDTKIEKIAVLRLDKYNGEKAQFMSSKDISDIVNVGWTERETIDEYIRIFNNVLALYYDIYDLTIDWNEIK